MGYYYFPILLFKTAKYKPFIQKCCFDNKNSTKNLGWATVSSSFLSSDGLLDFRNPVIVLFNLNIHFLLTFFSSLKLHPEGMLGLRDSNQRKLHSGHRIPFTCREVAGLCCKDDPSEDKYSCSLSKFSLGGLRSDTQPARLMKWDYFPFGLTGPGFKHPACLNMWKVSVCFFFPPHLCCGRTWFLPVRDSVPWLFLAVVSWRFRGRSSFLELHNSAAGTFKFYKFVEFRRNFLKIESRSLFWETGLVLLTEHFPVLQLFSQ